MKNSSFLKKYGEKYGEVWRSMEKYGEKYGEVWRKVWRSMEICINCHFSCKKDELEVFKKVWRKVWRSTYET